MKLGELIGLRDAAGDASRRCAGRTASRRATRAACSTRSADTACKEATVFDDIAPFLSEADLELLKKNSKAVFYEPLVGAAAHALATVCDRVRYGTLPDAVAPDAMVQQAATLAANLAAQVASLARVPRAAAAARDRRREDARPARHRARLVREVAHRVTDTPGCARARSRAC